MSDDVSILGESEYRYAEVERALSEHFMVPPANLGTFKARIRHFQKIGITPLKTGKGKAITYSVTDVMAIAFCINLAELSISPSSIKRIFQRCWELSLLELSNAKPGEVVSLFVIASFFSEALGIRNAENELHNSVVYYGSMPSELRQYDRAIVLNLTAIRRGVLASLSRRSGA